MSVAQFKPHQTEAYDAAISEVVAGKGSAKGRIVIPTAGGKTWIEAAILDYQRQHNSKTRIHLVLAPRILLANQLIDEYRAFSGMHYRSIAFHSGKYEPESETINWKETNTTQVHDVMQAWIDATACGQDLVIFSTYHSCDRLTGINFDTLIADESQYCVSENFNESIRKLSARVSLFFTATEKFTASSAGRGLNNESTYGKRLYAVSAQTLIARGIIVAPRLHIMYGNTKNEEKSIINEIIELATAQDALTRPELGFSKILFAMKGTKDVKTITDNLAKIKVAFPDHDVCTITSKSGAKVNGVKIKNKEGFVKEIKTSSNCLIFHYDILSEGIDVDGITGVCLLRNLGLAKLLQTIGRAIRIYKLNPNLKKQAWISIPVINGNEDDKAYVKLCVEAMRSGGFDISKEDVVEGGTRHSSDDDEGPDDAYGKLKSNFSNLFITEILHEVEQSEFWDKINSAGDINAQLDAFLSEV